MLRITVVEGSGQAVALRLEGRMTGRWVEELQRSCEVHALSEGIALSLDLADVSFVDGPGITLLKELRGLGVALVNPSPFIAEQLKEAVHDSR